MKHILLLIILFSSIAKASLPDFSGSSASTMGLGNQCSFDAQDPANNYYCPALLAETDKSSFNLNSYIVHQNLTPIKNIVVSNELNDPTASTTYGDVDVNQPDQYFIGAHAAFKLFKKSNTKLSVSVFSPYEKFIDVDTGDAYKPEYVMYKSRYKRMQFFSSLNFSYNKQLKYSVGVLGGMQSSGRTNIIASQAGAQKPSSGSMSINASPSIAPVFSLSYKWNQQHHSYFGYQSEMKSQIEQFAEGYTPVGSSSVKYNWKLSSMLYYDPATIRLGHQYKTGNNSIIGSLEYQQWQNYQTPKLVIKQQSGILISSQDFEDITMRDILIAKIGYKLQMDKSSLSFGYGYRPTPLKKDHSKAGNSLDSNLHMLSIGHSRSYQLMAQDFNFDLGLQLHQLEKVKVDKGPNMEDGETGEKIGSGGYKIGGQVFVLSLGVSWVL